MYSQTPLGPAKLFILSGLFCVENNRLSLIYFFVKTELLCTFDVNGGVSNSYSLSQLASMTSFLRDSHSNINCTFFILLIRELLSSLNELIFDTVQENLGIHVDLY